MEKIINNQKSLDATINNQSPKIITKKITFNIETYKNLVTIASREYFNTKMKPDEMVASMLDQIINSYYKQYWEHNKPV